MSDTIHDQEENAAPDERNAWGLLRQAREERGLSLGEVSAYLKLTVRQLEAIERGDLSVLPGQTFARGFVRNYARFLDLDPGLFLAGSVAPEAKLVMSSTEASIGAGLGPMPVQGGRRFSALPALFIVFLLLVVIGSGWYYGWFEDRSEQALLQSATPVVLPAEPVAVTSAAVPVVEASVPVADASAVPGASAPVATDAPAAAASQPANVAVSTDGLPRLVMNFDGEAWVEVRDGTGKVIFARLNAPGSVQEVQGTPPFSLIVGKAPNVRLTWKGQAVDLAPDTRGDVARLSLK